MVGILLLQLALQPLVDFDLLWYGLLTILKEGSENVNEV
jgi:hypothetical protein